jgi:hypothetical protein
MVCVIGLHAAVPGNGRQREFCVTLPAEAQPHPNRSHELIQRQTNPGRGGFFRNCLRPGLMKRPNTAKRCIA